jgi:quinol monooxygenase YgiN
VRDSSVFAGRFGLPNDEFLLPWRSISAKQPGGLDARQQGWSAPMVIVAGHITVEPLQRESYLADCARIVEQARRGIGCLDFAICADLVDPGRVNIFERWESQAALETFRGSGPDTEQRLAMLTVSVQEFDIADIRPAFGKGAE